MSSAKDIYEADICEANIFAAGVFRGVGVDVISSTHQLICFHNVSLSVTRMMNFSRVTCVDEDAAAVPDYSVAVDTFVLADGTLTNFLDPEGSRSIDKPSVLTGRSLEFAVFSMTAASEYVAIPEIPRLDGGVGERRSLGAWIKPTNLSAGRVVFGNAGPGGTNYVFLFTAGSLFVGAGTAVNQVFWTITPAQWTGIWRHLALSMDGASVDVFFDGVSQGAKSLPQGLAPITRIGLGPDDQTNKWVGLIDDVRDYDDVALSAAQWAQVVAGGEVTGVSPSRLYKFDEGVVV